MLSYYLFRVHTIKMIRISGISKILRVMSTAVLFNIAVLQTTSAGEIRYGSIKDVRGDEILAQYKGPGGPEYFICNSRSLECVSKGTGKPHLFPSIHNSRNYVHSTDGRFAIVEVAAADRNKTGSYILYMLDRPEPEPVTRITLGERASRIIFAPDNNVIVLFANGGKIFTYSVDTGDLATAKIPRTGLSYLSLSYRGSYLSGYDKDSMEYVIWDARTGAKTIIAGELPGHMKFSSDERYAAFHDKVNGYQGIRLVELGGFPHNISVRPLQLQRATVVDSIFAGNNLYYVSNALSPYAWSIHEYDIRKNTGKVIATDVSYSGKIMRIDARLAYLRIEGKNTNIALYDPHDGVTEVLRPYPDSPVSPLILREEVSMGGYHGVLVRPLKDTCDSVPLFVWLHGGPRRQTSAAYHSYLSYAVYDELLDRITLAGSCVLKLDYPGSFGYGYDFADSLSNNIGVIDVSSVILAVEQLKKESDIDDVYLIGNSYGGYLSIRTLVEKPGLFSGAISINGVYDWFTLIGYINSSPFKDLFDGTPDLEDHERNMGLYHAAGIYNRVSRLDGHKILLVLGENDATVPVWQTKEFFHVLGSLKKSVELLTFADEGHILRKRGNLDKLCSRVLSLASQPLDVCANGE
jgi:pimeloyl-ACP methyl ester carboxylesterase